jgi:hypothetical protein
MAIKDIIIEKTFPLKEKIKAIMITINKFSVFLGSYLLILSYLFYRTMYEILDNSFVISVGLIPILIMGIFLGLLSF